MNFPRRFALVMVCGLAAMLVPGTLLKSLAPGAAAPNLIVILMVFLSFYDGRPTDALLAFLLGLMLDLGSLNLLGPWAGAYVAVFGVLVLFSRRIFIESPLVVFLTVFFAAVCCDFAQLGVLSLAYDGRAFTPAALSLAVWEGLLSGALAPFLFPLLRRWIGGAARDGEIGGLRRY